MKTKKTHTHTHTRARTLLLLSLSQRPASAEPIAGAPCGTVNGVVVDGVLDDDKMLCCPAGCGTCGGTECSTMPMSWVMPDPDGGPLAVDPSVPADATSGGEQTKTRVCPQKNTRSALCMLG